MMSKQIISGAMFAALLGATVAMAEDAESARPYFNDVDVDQSGSITREEAESFPALADTFSALDADADGEVSATEYLWPDKADKTN